MTEYRNRNGLANGLIPAGQGCPFLDRCKFKVHTCPGVDGKTKENNFSCAAARAFSLANEADKEKPGTGYLLRRVVEKEQLIVLEVPKKRFSWGTMNAVTPPEEDK